MLSAAERHGAARRGVGERADSRNERSERERITRPTAEPSAVTLECTGSPVGYPVAADQTKENDER